MSEKYNNIVFRWKQKQTKHSSIRFYSAPSPKTHSSPDSQFPKRSSQGTVADADPLRRFWPQFMRTDSPVSPEWGRRSPYSGRCPFRPGAAHSFSGLEICPWRRWPERTEVRTEIGIYIIRTTQFNIICLINVIKVCALTHELKFKLILHFLKLNSLRFEMNKFHCSVLHLPVTILTRTLAAAVDSHVRN